MPQECEHAVAGGVHRCLVPGIEEQHAARDQLLAALALLAPLAGCVHSVTSFVPTSTIIAAEITSRSCHAIELNPAYVEVALARWQAFTGEEAGLLGSREYVRQAVASGVKLAGALNNDMVGFANDHRLDNTIRYSNPGIRDIQHAAAIFYSDLITYDALYYKSTDAAAYYEAYGDIVGGIGSYPVLGNPHYHEPTDRLDTVNQEQVAETCKATVATPENVAKFEARRTELEKKELEGGSLLVAVMAAVTVTVAVNVIDMPCVL